MQYSLLGEAPAFAPGPLAYAERALFLAHNRPDGQRRTSSQRTTTTSIDQATGNPGLDNKADSWSVGATTNLSDTVTLGVAAGQTKGRNQFMAGTGNFNTNDKILSLFGSVRVGGFYGTGVVSLSELKYTEIRRNITIGPVVRTANANTDGSNASRVFRRLRLTWRNFMGPLPSVTMQNVGSGFGATSANRIRPDAQVRGVISGRASMDLGELDAVGSTWWERRDDVRLISATPLGL